MRLAVIDDERFDAHRPTGPHPEHPGRLPAARSGLEAAVTNASGVDIVRLQAELARPDQITAVHTSAYLANLETALAAGRSSLDPDTYCSAGTREAAFCAAGGAAKLATTLLNGDADAGIGLLRPPGHHAESDRAMGFCLLNNVAIAAEAALAAGAGRVAILDWDVHHGNGTQHHFDARDDVLFVSLHEWPLYPGTGASDEVGRGSGVGKTANLALPSGSGDEDYAGAFREVVLPLLRAHAPDLVLVSAGYDAHDADPLAGMALSAEMYGAMASAVLDLGAPVGFLLEGGYDLAALEASVNATAAAAMGLRTTLPEGRVSTAARAGIDATREALGPLFPTLER